LTKEDSWYVAKCIENNITSQGKTLEKAIANLKEAIELFYEDEKDIPYEFSNIIKNFFPTSKPLLSTLDYLNI
jgi:predicted RNase H-like HicB family nuclease